MSKDPEKVRQAAATIVATQLFKVVEASPKGLAEALTMCASMAAAVIDQAEKPDQAWDYFEKRVQDSRRVGTELTRALDAGEVTLEQIERVAKTGGSA